MPSPSILIPDEDEYEPAEDAVQRGKLAEQVLENPMFTYCLREAERDALLEWMGSKDPVRREQIHAELQFKERLIRMFNALIQDSEVLEHILNEQEGE